jgi:hypothetical protein
MTIQGTIQVYVDAKIKGMHDKNLPKRTFVGYFVEEPRMSGAKEVDADETDDAEIEAILFAIEQFKGKYDLVKIVCDHLSVVSEARKEPLKSDGPLMIKLKNTLAQNENSVKLDLLKPNPAHRIVTEYANQKMQ